MTQAPLHEVVRELSARSRQLGLLDTEISQKLQEIEEHLRQLGITRVYSVRLDSEASLGWSGRRERKGTRWRLVIVDDHPDAQPVDVVSSTREERADVLTSGALGRLVARVLSDRTTADRAVRPTGPAPYPRRRRTV